MALAPPLGSVEDGDSFAGCFCSGPPPCPMGPLSCWFRAAGAGSCFGELGVFAGFSGRSSLFGEVCRSQGGGAAPCPCCQRCAWPLPRRNCHGVGTASPTPPFQGPASAGSMHPRTHRKCHLPPTWKSELRAGQRGMSLGHIIFLRTDLAFSTKSNACWPACVCLLLHLPVLPGWSYRQ